MYDVIKNVITSKKYDLTDILNKIDVLWVQGSLSDEQRDELINLARSNAMTSNSVDVLAKLTDLDIRVKTLEDIIADLSNESNDGETEGEESGETTTVTYPEFENGKWYYNGDKVSFEGKNYNCTAPIGVVCTWSPKDYPAYWEEAIEESGTPTDKLESDETI